MKTLRQHKISEYVHLRGQVSISELLVKFDISRATIHRDLVELEQQGELIRGRGLVRTPDQEPQLPEHTVYSRFQDRLHRNHDAKSASAKRAAALINDGDIIFLDSSTTVYYLAHELQKMPFSNLTIITNSVLIIQEFSAFPTDYSLIALGGNYDVQLNAFLGKATEAGLNQLKIDKAFVSALGITPDGAFSRHEFHASFLQQVIAKARQNYLLITDDKFDRPGLFPFAQLSQFAGIISSSDTLPGYCAQFFR